MPGLTQGRGHQHPGQQERNHGRTAWDGLRRPQGQLRGHRSAGHGGRAVRDKNPQEAFTPRGSEVKGPRAERASVPALPPPSRGTSPRPRSHWEAQFIHLCSGNLTTCPRVTREFHGHVLCVSQVAGVQECRGGGTHASQVNEEGGQVTRRVGRHVTRVVPHQRAEHLCSGRLGAPSPTPLAVNKFNGAAAPPASKACVPCSSWTSPPTPGL